MREIYLVYVWFLHAHVDQGNKKVKELAIYFFLFTPISFYEKKSFPIKKRKTEFFYSFSFLEKGVKHDNLS